MSKSHILYHLLNLCLINILRVINRVDHIILRTYLCRGEIFPHRLCNEEGDGDRRRDAVRCPQQHYKGKECAVLAVAATVRLVRGNLINRVDRYLSLLYIMLFGLQRIITRTTAPLLHLKKKIKLYRDPLNCRLI